jgi:AcrR family transcriptional regulator
MELNRRSSATREALLDAAIEEFIERGFAGMRMEHVAKRAGYNKALLYRHFKDKETLLREALKRRFSQRAQLLGHLPETLAGILAWWSDQTLADPNFMRMILREALDTSGTEPAHSEFRRAYYRHQIELVKRLQAEGSIDPAFDPEMLFIALLSVVTLTGALPQIVQLATELHPCDAKFERRWDAFLEMLAAHLSRGSCR